LLLPSGYHEQTNVVSRLLERHGLGVDLQGKQREAAGRFGSEKAV